LLNEYQKPVPGELSTTEVQATSAILQEGNETPQELDTAENPTQIIDPVMGSLKVSTRSKLKHYRR
jgi:hypothetical protein